MATLASKPVVKRYMLECDTDGEAWVEIQQATIGAKIARDKVIAIQRMRQSDYGGTEFIIDTVDAEIMMVDIYHTLVGMGGMWLMDDDGSKTSYEPFKFKTGVDGVKRLAHSETQFISLMENSRLTSDYFEEIHKYVLEVNPTLKNPNV